MRQTLFNIAMLFSILLAPAFSWAIEPDQEFSRSINREFSTSTSGTTAIYNKYGKVTVSTWNQNSVKIDINIVVNARNQQDADRIFDRIKVNFQNANGYVKAETVIEQVMNCNNGENYKINFDVKMPAENQLDLRNKYGNSVVSGLNGKLIAEIKYGDLRTDAIPNDIDLNLGYGKANIGNCSNLNGVISYSELAMNTLKNLQIDTKYSEITLNKADDVRIVSRYDDFNLGTLNELQLQTKYANLRVQSVKSAYVTGQYTEVDIFNLSGNLDSDLSYGSLNVEVIKKTTNNIQINSKYTSVTLGSERGLTAKFDISGHNTDIQLPSSVVKQLVDKSGTDKRVKGYVGEENAKLTLKATLSYGSFVWE